MQNYKLEFKWALIFTGMSILWMTLERLFGLHDVHIDKHAIYTNFVAIPAIAIYVFALREKKKNNYNGNMSYLQGFVTGMIMTLIITLFSPVSLYITVNFITPEYFNNAINYAVQTGMLTLENAEKYFEFNNYLVQSLVGSLIAGTLTTAVVAIFTRTKK